MARCPVELLDDLAGVLAEVQRWTGVIETGPAVLYLGRQPFLHFHLVEGRRRRADVKTPTGWLQLDVPRPLSATRRRAFLSALRRRHAERAR
jgi:hypothetical protein